MKINLDHIRITITRTKRKIVRIAIIAAVFAVIFIFLGGLALANRNKIIYGLKLADISVGGRAASEAQAKISQLMTEFLEQEIVLRYQNQNEYKIWTAKPEELGVKIDIGSTLDKIIRIGHRGKLFSDLGQQILALFGYYNFALSYQINENPIKNFIEEKLDDINNPAINASWQYDEGFKRFVQIPSQEGMVVNQQDFQFKLRNKLETFSKDDIFLTLISDYPEIVEDETISAYEKAQEILANAPYQLIINDPLKYKPVKISLIKDELIPMIEFQPVLDPSAGRTRVRDENNPKNKVLGIALNEQALKDYLIVFSSSINRNPVDAKFVVVENRVTDFVLSQNGLRLEIEENILKLKEKIITTDEKEIELKVSIISPKIATKDIDNLGITTFIGKGVSNFSGSPKNRIHNIGIGAARFNGILIKPNEEFSFINALGEVGPEQGYLPELTIKKDKTIPEYGGGLCQVSTTAFRAAFNTGLSIRERTAHAFPVKYYNPQGFDATIYPPHPDLRFVNDTPGYLLIQTKINGYELTFEFYGTSDGRKVEIEGPYQYDIKEDGSMKAKLIRRIYDKDGNFILESVFNSNYKSPSLYPIERNPLE